MLAVALTAATLVPLTATAVAQAATFGPLTVTSPQDAALGLSAPRLVFSTVARAATPAKSFTFRNNGATSVTISNLAVGGTNTGSFALAPGQPTSFTLGGGASANVSVVFTPTAATGCGTSTTSVERYALLQYTTNSAAHPSGALDLAGYNACGYEGSSEPILAQIVRVLGYTTKVIGGSDVRYLGPKRIITSGDEKQSPYFVRADTSQPVTLTTAAHTSGRNTSSGGFGRTGWFPQGSAAPTPCTAAQGCNELFRFAPDTATSYVENQKLFPAQIGTSSFTPPGAFGIWNGESTSINFTDDAKNFARSGSGTPITPSHYLHNFRVYPALGPGRVQIANTWLLVVDLSRIPSGKNNDFQDVVLILRNAKPAVATAAATGSSSLQRTFTSTGTVSSGCAVTGFSGVLANTAGTQCNSANMSFSSAGLRISSTPGEMGGSKNAQQNALYNSFDASRGGFTVTTRVVGPLNYLSANYQQVATWFGPDQDNYVKVEAEHNGAGTDPHITMFFEQKGSGSSAGTVSLPALTSASTVDLVIKGNTTFANPISGAADINKLNGYPLAQVTAFYSINGGPLVQVGSVRYPSDVMTWFSTSAKAGILVSGGGAASAITGTFRSFAITSG